MKHMLKRDLLKQLIPVAIIATVAAVLLVAPAVAAKGGHATDPPCSVSASSVAVGESFVVSASGLPTDSAINFWVTDPNGHTVGTPLGSTPDGLASLTESASSTGKWTYTFSGPTKNNPSTTPIYATCSVNAY
jgi:hypothetical protein